MSARSSESSTVLVGVVMGSAALLGGVMWAVAAWPRAREAEWPSTGWQTGPTYTEADVEAAARMVASENPRGSRALHVEQIHTQLRSRKQGQSLFERITAGSGWGPQGERRAGGGVRPVSTENAATDAERVLAREVLDGMHPSQVPGARKFFEPAQQDGALAIAMRARQKQAAGAVLTAQEQRLLRYRKSAAEVRRSWMADGARHVATMDGVEFFT